MGEKRENIRVDYSKKSIGQKLIDYLSCKKLQLNRHT
jgi:hypothetical protein